MLVALAQCPGEASETGVVAGRIPVRLVDELGPLANDDVKARLESVASELQYDPESQTVILSTTVRQDW